MCARHEDTKRPPKRRSKQNGFFGGYNREIPRMISLPFPTTQVPDGYMAPKTVRDCRKSVGKNGKNTQNRQKHTRKYAFPPQEVASEKYGIGDTQSLERVAVKKPCSPPLHSDIFSILRYRWEKIPYGIVTYHKGARKKYKSP